LPMKASGRGPRHVAPRPSNRSTKLFFIANNVLLQNKNINK
jgi:hypothetical protein